MSDSESTLPAPSHPNLGGKSIESLTAARPRYKSWRKKFRKMRHNFDGVLEENKRLFKEEQKLEAIAKRLREELDGLLELCLDINQNPSVSPRLRFGVDGMCEGEVPQRREAVAKVVDPDITPEEADRLYKDYIDAVKTGQTLRLDLPVMREMIDMRLAAQGVEPLSTMERNIPHAFADEELPGYLKGEEPHPGYWTTEQEFEYLKQLDKDLKLEEPNVLPRAGELPKDGSGEEKHWAELTPRELERQAELLNPQSQHNWLKNHAKLNPNAVQEIDDNESLASHDNVKASAPRKRGGNSSGKGNLARQVGDRAVERAREGFSPSAASGIEEDELAGDDGLGVGGSGKKRARDPDGTYRLKGGKGGSNAKGKRKRSGEDLGVGSSAGGKKARVDGGME